ncbi:argininosuccinate lyase [Stigmatella sp. ncwal1]|uniref:Argininosuccinate lyase n=1 Tax=Stigmatella ashevillensis TaxID=2995309 RepID=A0ABT5D6U0_9BACT|nr:argininosuccinate lyase [Stigmatella ashevillena]MDC0709266.1 argininosuccinate lyase [Stigmatella ashevillena]
MAEETLWGKGLALDTIIHGFTVGDDPQVDLALAPHDALGSAAHARMLARVGLLSQADMQALVTALRSLHDEARAGAFTIRPEQEDGHTALEAALVERVGEPGRRIHLGRSRNDQVQLALRLLLREEVLVLGARAAELAGAFLDFAQAHADKPMPGYTHMRRAMPSTFGLWGAAFAEALLEELEALKGLWARVDRCPLGAAAGFGVPLPIDREYVATLLGFSRVQRSPIDVQNSRGRLETATLSWACSISSGLEKWLWDLALFTTEEFGFLTLPDAFTTGSSIMPQKKNPDVVELARGRCRELRGMARQVEEVASGLPSSYHRDFQLLKRPTLTALTSLRELLEVATRLVPVLQLRAEAAARACDDTLYAAHHAFTLAGRGLPFRDAYREVAHQLADGTFRPDRAALTATHLGGAGNLGLEQARAELATSRAWLTDTHRALADCAERIWHP